MDMLMRYDWPGNVRELENAMERAVILTVGEYVTERSLPLAIQQMTGNTAAVPSGILANKSLDDIEKKPFPQHWRKRRIIRARRQDVWESPVRPCTAN